MKKYFTIIAVFFSASIFAQIPNAGFESWDNSAGYNNPVGWDNMNAMTSSMSVYTCVKGTPGAMGNSYLKLVSSNVTGMGVMPGIATCGMLDMTNMSAPVPMSGFAFTQRPQTFSGKWQYMASGNDQGFINVLLTKWNSTAMKRDTIASSMQMLSGMAMSWANFSMTLTYSSLSFPDTAFITLSASGTTPVAGSYLYADTLQFAGSVAGNTGINDLTGANANISVFPNPTSDVLNIQFSGLQSSACTVQLINIQGAVVRTANNNSSVVKMNIADLAKGVYVVKASSDQGIITKRVIIE
jgi:hypothetical protein